MAGVGGDRRGPRKPRGDHRGDGKFRVVYVGALGRWNGNETLVDAAVLLKDDPGIEFVVVGDGDQRPELEERAPASGARMRFLRALPKDRAVEQIRAADACVVCTWDHPFHKMVLANKIFDYLGAGKPVLAAARGEMEQLLAEAGAGLSVPPGDPGARCSPLPPAGSSWPSSGSAGRMAAGRGFWEERAWSREWRRS